MALGAPAAWCLGTLRGPVCLLCEGFPASLRGRHPDTCSDRLRPSVALQGCLVCGPSLAEASERWTYCLVNGAFVGRWGLGDEGAFRLVRRGERTHRRRSALERSTPERRTLVRHGCDQGKRALWPSPGRGQAAGDFATMAITRHPSTRATKAGLRGDHRAFKSAHVHGLSFRQRLSEAARSSSCVPSGLALTFQLAMGSGRPQRLASGTARSPG
jgi:hypothetical protein